MTGKVNIAILISGRGSNMDALIRACTETDYPARIVTVISNRPDAPGLAKAATAGIPSTTLSHRDFSDGEAFEESIHNHLIQNNVDLVCLAGFMRILSAGFVQNWPDRILNIHPSLLPDYPGLHPQARALADGKSQSGCSVHIVTAAMDAGPILVQRCVPVLSGDTEEDLSARILEQEHLAYPEAVRIHAQKLLNRTAVLDKTINSKEMSMDTHHVSVNQKELIRAHAMWTDFIRFARRGVVVVVVLLVLMAIFLV